MRKLTIILLTVLLVTVFLGVLTPVAPVSAGTWDPTLHWDFEDHTNTHPHMKRMKEAQIRAEEEAVNAAFIAHGYAVPQHMAYPYGEFDALVELIVSQYRKSARTVSGTMEAYPVPNWYRLKCAQLRSSTSWNTLKGYVDQCIAANKLLHIFTHDISSKPSTWGCTPAQLTQLLDYLKQKQDAGELQVLPMAQAYDVWSSATSNPEATVVVSFDGGNESDYTQAYPMFMARGFIGTSYITISFLENTGYLTWAEIATMRAGA